MIPEPQVKPELQEQQVNPGFLDQRAKQEHQEPTDCAGCEARRETLASGCQVLPGIEERREHLVTRVIEDRKATQDLRVPLAKPASREKQEPSVLKVSQDSREKQENQESLERTQNPESKGTRDPRESKDCQDSRVATADVDQTEHQEQWERREIKERTETREPLASQVLMGKKATQVRLG